MSLLPISETLWADIKAHLDYTWEDDALTRKYQGFVRSGMVYLNGKLPEPADYEADGLPRTLLFEYVRNARDGAMDVFENNYMSMILAMQNEEAVQRHAKKALSEGQ